MRLRAALPSSSFKEQSIFREQMFSRHVFDGYSHADAAPRPPAHTTLFCLSVVMPPLLFAGHFDAAWADIEIIMPDFTIAPITRTPRQRDAAIDYATIEPLLMP